MTDSTAAAIDSDPGPTHGPNGHPICVVCRTNEVPPYVRGRVGPPVCADCQRANPGGIPG